MTDETRLQKPKIETLELNKETLQDLSEREADRVQGGVVDEGGVVEDERGANPRTRRCTPYCQSRVWC